VKLLTGADNLMIATLWRDMLQAAGIACEVRNRYLAGAIGELPADQVAPQIWVHDERDETYAQALLREWRRPGTLAAWNCFRCGEHVEGQFYQCWNCEAARPGSGDA
jgi:Putative prokaryotic signal transducing protein